MIEIKDDAGAVLHQVDAPTLAGASLANCYLRNAQLVGADLRGANLRDADLREANLKGADLRGTKIDDTNFEGADLEGANLEGVTVNSAKTTFANTRLMNAKMARANFFVGSMAYTKLEGADLTGAELRSPLMQGVHLSHAIINDTHIGTRDMCGALLVDADFSKVRLLFANNLHEAYFDHTTKWPLNFGLLQRAIGKLNLLSATTFFAGLGGLLGAIWDHPWSGGFFGALLAYIGLPFLLWKSSRFVADVRDWTPVHGAAVVVVIGVVATWNGCVGNGPSAALSGFEISWQQGLLTDDVSVTYPGTKSGEKPIERAEFSLTVYFQNGQKPVIRQYRELWRPGETIKVNLPAEGNIERVELTGTGHIGGQVRQLTSAWVSTTKTNP